VTTLATGLAAAVLRVPVRLRAAALRFFDFFPITPLSDRRFRDALCRAPFARRGLTR